MSFFEHAIFRGSASAAKNFVDSAQYEPDCISLTDDGSIVLEYETYHGTPYEEFPETGYWMKAYANEDGDSEIIEDHANPEWAGDLYVDETDVMPILTWTKFGKGITEKELAELASREEKNEIVFFGSD